MSAANWGNWTITTLQITGSNVSGPLSAVLVGGDGTAGSETAQDVAAFGAPGIVFRPRPPEDVAGSDGQNYTVGAEALGVRQGDEIKPFTWRDLRINKVFPAPKPGTIALVGYGGAFLSFDDTDAGDSRTTLYVPYAGGTKCHTIVLDPEAEVIGIVHGEGMAIGMSKDGGIVARADSSTTWTLKPGLFQVIASKIVLQGNCVIGARPETAVPLSPGALTPPACPSVFVSVV